MKKNILICALFTCLSLLTWSEVAAQSETSRTKSRLNIGTKPSPSAASSFFKFPSSLDRTVSVRPGVAINAYYRSILLTQSTTANASSTNKSRTSKDLPSSVASETRPNIEEVTKSDDFLFTSDKLRVLNAYPNPANDYTEIDYQMSPGAGNARVSMFNVIGNNVGEYELDKNDRQLRIQTREMPTGVYFYRLLLDGKTVATKKLLVRH
ncbi:MAG: T9SS type A sorting domain-containing protein [Spirosomataceae bacterium]